MAATIAVAACTSTPEVRPERRDESPPGPIILGIDVAGFQIALVGQSGALCDGEVGGAVTITRQGGEAQRFDVRAPTFEERCPNCLPSGDDERCPCERVPLQRIEILRNDFGLQGDYDISGCELLLSCAPGRARFTDASVAYDGTSVRMRSAGEPPTLPVPPPAAPVPAPETPAPTPTLAPVTAAKRLDVIVRELGSDRPVAGVQITLGEVQECALPRGRRPRSCRPARPRRLQTRTDAQGIARFTLPAPRVSAVSEPAGLHYYVVSFRWRDYVGSYPLDEGQPVARQTRLVAWEPLRPPASGQRVTYWVVPEAALRVTSAEAARASTAQQPELAAWIGERAATVRSVTQRGLLWFVQWEAATGFAGEARCAVVDALEGGVRILGTQTCVF